MRVLSSSQYTYTTFFAIIQIPLTFRNSPTMGSYSGGCKTMCRTLLEGVWLSDIGRMAEVRNVPHLAWCEYRVCSHWVYLGRFYKLVSMKDRFSILLGHRFTITHILLGNITSREPSFHCIYTYLGAVTKHVLPKPFVH